MSENDPAKDLPSIKIYDIYDAEEGSETRQIDLPAEVRQELQKLALPGVTFDQAVETITNLNQQYGPKEDRYGNYEILHVDVPPTADGDILEIRVKVFTDMNNALSFSIGRES